MKVYRYLSEKELQAILAGDTANLGNYFSRKNANTFAYQEDTKYIHFFKDKENMRHVRTLSCTNHYFCSFHIPSVLLFLHAGNGYYWDSRIIANSGGEIANPYCIAKEFAIPVDLFDCKWLYKYILDEKSKSHRNDMNFAKCDANYGMWGYDLEL